MFSHFTEMLFITTLSEPLLYAKLPSVNYKLYTMDSRAKADFISEKSNDFGSGGKTDLNVFLSANFVVKCENLYTFHMRIKIEQHTKKKGVMKHFLSHLLMKNDNFFFVENKSSTFISPATSYCTL